MSDLSDGQKFLGICVVLILFYLYSTSNNKKETFLPTQTWEDWDNYDADYGNTRAYWGNMDPEGGWSGSQHSPTNDPSGVGFGAATPNYGGYQGYGRRRRRPKKQTNLAEASDAELSAMYRAGIMATK